MLPWLWPSPPAESIEFIGIGQVKGLDGLWKVYRVRFSEKPYVYGEFIPYMLDEGMFMCLNFEDEMTCVGHFGESYEQGMVEGRQGDRVERQKVGGG